MIKISKFDANNLYPSALLFKDKNYDHIYQPINEDYEYVQYNSELLLIHHLESDLYQLESLLDNFPIDLTADDVLSDPEIQDVIEKVNDLSETELLPSVVAFQDLEQLNDEDFEEYRYQNEDLFERLNGIYVHKFLINIIAMKYSTDYLIKCVCYFTPKLELSNF